MYEYPEITPKTDILLELHAALKHDPLLYTCFKVYNANCDTEHPFNQLEFFKYLAYMALSTNQKHIKRLVAIGKGGKT